jgi:N-acetylglucosaminyldiphosphoundecaprenol N-acetyl-beta-D-mannosaminyltransferase
VAGADLVLADGQPIIWGARVLGLPLPQRVAGSDLFPRLCAHAAEHGYRVFFLGGAPGAAEGAREALLARHPQLQVVGVHCPPMGFERRRAERRAALRAVQVAQPQLVFVGLGSPKQEHWIVENMQEYGPAVSIGIGISFSFVAGHVKRAPLWMQHAGLEWLHRAASEPRRLAWRYFVRGWRLPPIAARDLVRAWVIHRPLIAERRSS